MPDILLIQPPIRDFYLTEKRTIPYGLACIASALLKAGFSVAILDCLATPRRRVIEWPEEMAYLEEHYGMHDLSPFALFHRFRHFGYGFRSIGERARESGAYLVGISSLFTPYSREALRTAEAVKELHPRCRIVLGGHHPTAMPEQVMECGAVDYVIRGEGEAAMPALAGALREGRSVEEVDGIVCRRSDGTLKVSDPVCLDDMDQAPRPAMHLINHAHYSRGGRGSAVVVASRGCPMLCSYCSVGASSHLKYRRRSVRAVLDEIDEAVTVYGAGFIDFEDENISLTRNRFLELLRGIRKRVGPERQPELRAMNGLLPTTLDDQVIAAMKLAGFKALNLSVGSTCREQLRHFRRPDITGAFDAVLRSAEKHGLHATGYIIVGAPGQNPEDSLSDLLYLAARRVLAGVSVYYPSPGSEDYRRCSRAGILPRHLLLMRSSALSISDTTTRMESATLLRLGRILNFIKLLIDEGTGIPEPEPLHRGERLDPADRIQCGRKLLGWFLHDGAIRGVAPEGTVFEHNASTKLCRDFIKRLKTTDVCGTK